MWTPRLAAFALAGLTLVASVRAQEGPVEAFPLTHVRLLDGPFQRAQDLDRQYLLAMEPDRLLAPYLREAGLEPKAEPYGNWESTGLDGHIGGHYLSALAFMVASTGDTGLRERLDYMVSELKRAQDAIGTGYLAGLPDGQAMWAEVAAGDIRETNFGLNDRWVPLYNIHKTYAGLRDAYVHGGVEAARPLFVALADWALALVGGLSDAEVQQMLVSEHGGLNEVFADAAALTGDDRYLGLADRFSHRAILDPLEANEDRLTGLHANTQIPKVIGFQRVADVARQHGVAGYDGWAAAAAFFWNTVVGERTIAIGGNSVAEHFHPADDFSSMVTEPEGVETCNTYNMLRLTKLLFESDPQARYLDYYERALYNHILGSQHPETGGLVYFTPMRPSHYRVYSQPDLAMWCCVGSGIENHAKYGEMIYAHRGDDLFVNLFIPSTLDWAERGVRLRLDTRFPDAEEVTIAVEAGGHFALNLRRPAWTEGAMRVAVNGESVDLGGSPERSRGAEAGGFVRVERVWAAGDRVTVTLPMTTRLEALPDGSSHYAVLHGPVVLAAKTDPFEGERLEYKADGSRMGHVAQGALCPPTAAPVFVGDTDAFLAGLEPVAGEPLTFRAPDGLRGTDETLTLIPFFRLHDSRYVIYWPQATEAEYQARLDSIAAAAREQELLDARTVDQVTPGQQQPEVEHNFAGEGTESGYFRGGYWRHASGWFSYEFADPEAEAAVLRVTYSGGDSGRTFDILINDVRIETVTSTGHPDAFFHVDYPIPDEARRSDGVLVTRFQAHPGSMAGGVFDVRILEAD
ncbi:glycoside hydrolase family 127 protein [Rubrivirga marina]|uniref:Glycosyl hydrolase n=1 Tax=Rubrivirga marina TaxID=1196024 RepID=A0A271IUX8_9BACT|nr:glycoside hydrolase family 127 protein [Rubrivirga marina]PAP75046.1 glycosyl hydrolase [Rubrivirga marina]